MICPYCSGKRVQRATTIGLNALRILLDSNKRYCKDCKKRWQSRYSSDFRPRLYRIVLLAVLFAGALAGLRYADKSGIFSSFAARSSSGTSRTLSHSGDPNEIIREEAIRAGKLQRRAAFLARQQQRHR